MPPRTPWAALTALLSALLLTGCADTPPQVALAPRPDVPPDLLACQDQPEPPDQFREDADLAYWIIDLAAAGDDCRSRLLHVREVLVP
jgi:hypothetical protein